MTSSERDDLLVKLSCELDASMQEQHLSIARLARRADVSENTVQNILKAKPCQFAKLIAILNAVGLRMEYVFTKQVITPHS